MPCLAGERIFGGERREARLQEPNQAALDERTSHRSEIAAQCGFFAIGIIGKKDLHLAGTQANPAVLSPVGAPVLCIFRGHLGACRLPGTFYRTRLGS